MVYRGIYRDGVVILQGDVELENGTAVRVSPASPRRKPAARGAGRTHPGPASPGLWHLGRPLAQVGEFSRHRCPTPPAGVEAGTVSALILDTSVLVDVLRASRVTSV